MREKQILKIEGVKVPPGFRLLGLRPYSIHPSDNHLMIGLARKEDVEEYVTWVYNCSDGGFHLGHYMKDYTEAFYDFMERSFTEHTDWIVDVDVKPEEGLTAEDVEMDPAHIKVHQFEVQAYCRKDAIERALDKFHGTIPIGVLDDVHIDCKVKRKYG